MALFRNKYRVESARLTAWDYSTPGYYFVTVCAYDHQSIFGDIIDDKMRLNECGNIVWDEWNKTFEIRHELKPDEFVIMPNHFHCIVRIIDPGNMGDRIVQNIVETHGGASPNSCDWNVQNNVETHGGASLPQPEKQQPDKPQSEKPKKGIAFRPRKSISSLFAGYKTAVTKRINELRNTPGNPVWQSRFHDHIIRNNRELFAIRQYIRYNPANWDTDRNAIETQETKTGKQPWFVYMG